MGTRSLVLVASIALLPACFGSDDDAPAGELAGDYTVAITNRDNGCDLRDWTEGDTTSGIPFDVLQSGDRLTGVVQGPTGTWMNVVLGTNRFEGSGAGNRMRMDLIGTQVNSVAGCTWTVDVELDATLDGDFLTGELVYRPVTNGAATCATIEGCQNTQVFNGARPAR